MVPKNASLYRPGVLGTCVPGASGVSLGQLRKFRPWPLERAHERPVAAAADPGEPAGGVVVVRIVEGFGEGSADDLPDSLSGGPGLVAGFPEPLGVFPGGGGVQVGPSCPEDFLLDQPALVGP